MKKTIVAIALICTGSMAFAQNIKLDNTAANCKKVGGFGTNDRMAIASKYKVPVSSVRFMGANWQPGQYGGMTCVFVFDTANGPKKCVAIQLLSDDNGKTAFGPVAPFGNAVCWE